MKKIIAIAFALASADSFAADRTITKSAKPYHIVVAKDGSALAQFTLLTSDFRERGLLGAKKRLTSIQYRTTHYPDNLKEEVEICYYEPGRTTHVACEDVSPNSSGVIYNFNQYKFDMHARVIIRHSVKGGRDSGRSAGEDTITINYSF